MPDPNPDENILRRPAPPMKGEAHRPGDEISDIGEKTLIISREASESMASLDAFIRQRDIASETFGWGLTETVDDKTEKVTEFIIPDPDKTFSMEAVMLDQYQSKLMDLLGRADTLSLRLSGNTVAIVANDEPEDEWLSFRVGDEGNIDWGMADKAVQRLAGFDLPPTLRTFRDVLRQKGIRQDNGKMDFPLQTGWELILAGSSAIITQPFFDRVIQRARETGKRINFTMHHHPQLALAVLAMENRGLHERKKYFDGLLQFSPNDLAFMRANGIEFFEIRTMGTVIEPGNRTKTTRKIYSVTEILDTSEELGEAIDSVNRGSQPDNLDFDSTDCIRKIHEAKNKILAKGYPVRSLVEFYFGEQAFSRAKNACRAYAGPEDIKSPRDALRYALVMDPEDPERELKRLAAYPVISRMIPDIQPG